MRIDIPIVGDVKTVLKELVEKAAAKDDHAAWLDQIDGMEEKISSLIQEERHASSRSTSSSRYMRLRKAMR